MPFLDRSAGESSDTRGSRGLGQESAAAWVRDTYTSAEVRYEAPQHVAHRGAEKQACGNPECGKGWTLPWRNRRRPIFEGNWGCSTRCLEVVIGRALRRERGDVRRSMDQEVPHQHRIPLGLVMLGQGWIKQEQLRAALQAQRESGTGRIGEWLVTAGGVMPGLVTRGLAVQWSCPVLPLEGFAPSTMALAMPRIFVEEFGVLPLRVAGSRIFYLAFGDNLNASAALAMEQMSGLRVESGLLDDVQFAAARARLLEGSFVEAKEERYLDADALAEKIAAILEESQPIGSRLVRVHQYYWLRTWLESGAYSGIGTLPSTGEDVNDAIFTLGAGA